MYEKQQKERIVHVIFILYDITADYSKLAFRPSTFECDWNGMEWSIEKGHIAMFLLLRNGPSWCVGPRFGRIALWLSMRYGSNRPIRQYMDAYHVLFLFIGYGSNRRIRQCSDAYHVFVFVCFSSSFVLFCVCLFVVLFYTTKTSLGKV